MGLLDLQFPWRTLASANETPGHKRHSVGRFELLEPRQLLAADVAVVGSVYTEADDGSDSAGDTIEISFVGGAPGTQLMSLTFDGDKDGNGFDDGDIFFDTIQSGVTATNNGYGADGAFPATAAPNVGIDSAIFTIVDGTSFLRIDFTGFDSGEKFVFSIDVDEVIDLDFDPIDINAGIDPITSGVEFQGTILTADFQAPRHTSDPGSALFRDYYDSTLGGKGLDLPSDGQNSNTDRTAGAVVEVPQEPLPVTIAGTVYNDPNLNINQDTGELGIAGVHLDLWKYDGTVYQDTGHDATTDANGDYLFGTNLKLMPGTYQVRETQPTGYFSVGADPGTVDGANVGSIATVDILTDIVIPLGDQHAIDYDFAEALPVSVSGHVYHDRDNDGVRETGEEGIAGVRIDVIPVTTIDPTQATISLTTNAQGEYSTLDSTTLMSPGSYRIVEVTQPTGYEDGTDKEGTINGITMGTPTNPGDEINGLSFFGGQSGIDYDFGEYKLAQISGNVHLSDPDGNCFGSSYQVIPLENVTVRLLSDQGVTLETTLTDVNGNYSFVDLVPGDYTVVEETPVGLIDGGEHIGTIGGITVGTISANDTISQIQLFSDDKGIHYDFCEYQPATLSGYVYHDANNNGVKDAGEAPIQGATVTLYDSANAGTSAVTDATGAYLFTGLYAGTYSVVETQPAPWLDGKDAVGTINGVPVGVGGNDTTTQITLRWTENGVHYDFGEVLPASISGFVYHDRSGEGDRDPATEEGIEFVDVVLYDSVGAEVARDKTDANGAYSFDTLAAGEYRIVEDHPDGWIDGIDKAGSLGGTAVNPGDTIHTINVQPGDAGINYNFGEQLPGSISGFVWVDTQRNCYMDAGEKPLEGVQVDLLDPKGVVIQTTYTDVDGKYLFDNLPPGNYSVFEHQPPGYFHGGQMANKGGGTTDKTSPDLIWDIDITSGEDLTHFDFCEVPSSEISGYVFKDGASFITPDGQVPADFHLHRDGSRTSDDTPLSGVTLELRNGLSGDAIIAAAGVNVLAGYYAEGAAITTQTNGAGFYHFAGLKAGNYAIYEITPSGFVDSIDTPGSVYAIAVNPSDVVTASTQLSIDNLSVDPHDDAIIAMALAPGVHSTDNNFSEVQATPWTPPVEDPPFAPPVVVISPVAPVPVQEYIPPVIPLPPLTIGDGSGGALGFTWHLSVINSGQPRSTNSLVSAVTGEWMTRTHLKNSAWGDTFMEGGRWQLDMKGADPEIAERLKDPVFGMASGTPVSGDFNGDGLTDIGVFLKGEWFLDLNGNGVWDDGDLWIKLGHDGDLPIVGDWDGDGKDDIGIFGPAWPGDPRAILSEAGLPDQQSKPSGLTKNLPPKEDEATTGRRSMKLTAEGKMRTDLIDHVFHFGTAGDHPVAGDWNGDGIKTIAIFRDGQWHFDDDGDGRWSEGDRAIMFGQTGDLPVVGDFDGDGIDEIGIYSQGKWTLDSDGDLRRTAHDKVFEMGGAGDLPVVGDWDGDGIDQAGIYTPTAGGDAPLSAE